MVSRVTVRVPATTANMGPGFDCLGMAVDIWNEVTVEHSSRHQVYVTGEGAAAISRGQDNLLVEAVRLAFKHCNKPVPTLSYTCINNIPFGSGLGSSSAAIIAGIAAGAVLAGRTWEPSLFHEVLQWASELENHVDNLAPCLYGGMRIGFRDGDVWRASAVPVSDKLQCVVYVPSTPLSTKESRKKVPTAIPRDDAIFNIARAAVLVNAVATGQTADLVHGVVDKLHQPQRGELMPYLFPAISAALANGAKAAFLSGAGSSVMALTAGEPGRERNDKVVGDAMQAAAESTMQKLGYPAFHGRVLYSRPALTGVQVEIHINSSNSGSEDVGVKYISTRDVSGRQVSFETAFMEGLSPDGGLYVPTKVPKISKETIQRWSKLSYSDLAYEVMREYIHTSDIPSATLKALVHASYATFSHPHVTPLIELSKDGSLYLMEQFHGPTAAFKDVALQFVGNLFEFFLLRNGGKKTILAATSGDTGGAAIAGLRGKLGVEVFVLFPKGKVSPIQEAQMTSVMDSNVHNVAVGGTFDDCQAIVKKLFGDKEFNAAVSLGAVNSINWARILAQIVYYWFSYFRWLEMAPAGVTRTLGDKINFVVPTGNFGNVLSGHYAKRMGLPIDKLVVATNENDILHRFFSRLEYKSNGFVKETKAPAMDIDIPSNFERYLFELFGRNPAELKACMEQIAKKKEYSFGDKTDLIRKALSEDFLSSRASDAEIVQIIEKYKTSNSYNVCTHTACGLHAFGNLKREAGSSYICLATAHPGKFDEEELRQGRFQPFAPSHLRDLLHNKDRRCLLAENNSDQIKQLVLRELAAAGSKQGKASGCPIHQLPSANTLGAAVALAALAGALFLGLRHKA